MGDRVAVLKDGILQQVDTPRNMYDTPNNVFVAGFIGSPAMNLLEATIVEGGVVHFGGADHPDRPRDARRGRAEGGARRDLGFRPEDLDIVTDGPRASRCRPSTGRGARRRRLRLRRAAERRRRARYDIIARVDGRTPPAKGETVHVAHPAGPRARLLDRSPASACRLTPTACVWQVRRPACRSRSPAVAGRARPARSSRGRPRSRSGRPTSWSRCRAASPGTSCASSGSTGRSTRSRRSASTLAEREYGLLRQLDRLDVPCVEAVGVVTGRSRRRRRAARARRWSPGTCSSRCPTARCSPRRCARTPPTGCSTRCRCCSSGCTSPASCWRRLLAVQHAVPPRRRRVRGLPRRRRDRRAARRAVRRAARARPRRRPRQHHRRAARPRGRRAAAPVGRPGQHTAEAIIRRYRSLWDELTEALSRSTRERALPGQRQRSAGSTTSASTSASSRS